MLLCSARVVWMAGHFFSGSSPPCTPFRRKIRLIELGQEQGVPGCPLAEATTKVRAQVTVEGRVVGRVFDREQRATHGLAWLATYVEAVRQLASYAVRLTGEGTLGELEELLIRIGLGEYLAQVVGKIR